MVDERREVIGKTSASKESANTESEFNFWLKNGVLLNPFDFVTVEHEFETKTVGMVEGLSAVTDADSHLTNFVSNDFGNVETEPNTKRLSSTIAKCLVMHNTGKQHPTFSNININVQLPIQNDKAVFFSTQEEIEMALGNNTIPPERKIPAGVILQSNGEFCPIFLDRAYLLGPEGAHVNISGISGLATKTSYAMFLIQAILQKIEPKPIVIIFNVKRDDLLYIHQKPDEGDMDEFDEKLYEILEVKMEPFQNVKYYLPRGANGEPNSSRRFEVSEKYKVYTFSFKDVIEREELAFLFSDVEDPEYTIESIVYKFIADKYDIDLENTKWEHLKRWKIILKDKGQKELKDFLKSASIRESSIRKFERHLERMLNKNPGLFVTSLSESEREICLGNEVETLKSGDVAVIDISQVNDATKGFIIGCVMKAIEKRITEREESQPFLVFVDELNKYAPKSTRVSALTQQLIEITARGRSSGVALIGAEQFKSQIHMEVTENCSTHVIGRSGAMELSNDAYKFVPGMIKTNLTVLEKGELVIIHPLFKQPIKIRFPKPYYRRPKV